MASGRLSWTGDDVTGVEKVVKDCVVEAEADGVFGVVLGLC